MSIMKEQFKGKITRRAAMKTLASAGATAALAASAAPFVKGASTVRAVTGVGGTPAIVSLGKTKVTGAALCPPLPTDWTGRNTQLHRYDLAEGYPAYDPHPRYLGEISGSWYNMGRQYGERAADLIRMVYEGWYRELIAIQGTPENMLGYLHEQQTYYEALLPEGLEFMHGIAEGSGTELDASAFAHIMNNDQKILMINSYFGLQGPPPKSETAMLAPDDGVHCCSGAIILGAATKDGKTIHVSSEDQHFFPQEYLVTLVANPSDRNAHRFTVTDTAGEIGSEHAMNEKGVAVSGYAGGGMNVLSPTLSKPYSGYRRPGLDWQVGNFYAAAFAGTAKEAVELLTVGRPSYRQKSGYKIVIGKCNKGANWMVSDGSSAYLVESIPADQNGVARYAVRMPGDMGEQNKAYICSTNNVEGKDSYNEQNEYDPAHPMRQHGNATQVNASPNQHFAGGGLHWGLNGTGTRFCTFMWLIKNNYGNVTTDMVKEWRRSHDVYDMDGTLHKDVEINGTSVPLQLSPGVGTICRHTSGPAGTDTFKGINIYVTVSVAQDLVSYRTKGRPCEWTGPWDALKL
jgi:hypothetical protein